VRVSWAPTWQLTQTQLAEARRLLDEVFDGAVDELDWSHSLGGFHALARHHSALVGHAALVPRRVICGARILRGAFVEAVAVTPSWQRRGVGGRLMGRLETMIESGYSIGVLGSSPEGLGFYQRRGWRGWRGPTAAVTLAGVRSTPDVDGSILVWSGDQVDLDGPLTCDWRGGKPW